MHIAGHFGMLISTGKQNNDMEQKKNQLNWLGRGRGRSVGGRRGCWQDLITAWSLLMYRVKLKKGKLEVVIYHEETNEKGKELRKFTSSFSILDYPFNRNRCIPITGRLYATTVSWSQGLAITPIRCGLRNIC